MPREISKSSCTCIRFAKQPRAYQKLILKRSKMTKKYFVTRAAF